MATGSIRRRLGRRFPTWLKRAASSGKAYAGDPECPRLPFELWHEVFSHLDDHRDLIHVACASRSFSIMAKDFLKYYTLVLDSLDAVISFDDSDYLKSTLARKLVVRVEEEVNSSFIASLSKALYRLSSIHTVQLYIPGAIHDFEQAVDPIQPLSILWQRLAPTRARSRLVSRLVQAPLPLLRRFSSTTPTTHTILSFVQNHCAIEDLALAAAHPSLSRSSAEFSLPSSCRTLACATNVLPYLTTLPSVTHLFIIEHVLYTFELIPRPLAQQLVSLHFGPLSSDYYHSWEPHGSIELNTVDFLYDFPRLRYVEQHMRQSMVIVWGSPPRSPFLFNPIHWDPANPWDGVNRYSPPRILNIAWAFDKYDPTRTFEPQCDKIAEALFRTRSPHIGSVMYGDGGALDTKVSLAEDGITLVKETGLKWKEDYWKSI